MFFFENRCVKTSQAKVIRGIFEQWRGYQYVGLSADVSDYTNSGFYGRPLVVDVKRKSEQR